MPLQENRTPIQDRAIRLFSYLQELVQLRTPQVRDVQSYEAVLWFSEIPREEGCYSISWGAPLEDSDLWVEVRKRKEPPCPSPPEKCKEWVQLSELVQSDSEPRLRDRILAPAAAVETTAIEPDSSHSGESGSEWILLHDHPEVEGDWNQYLTQKWRLWAEKHRRWKAVQSIYGHLFSILQRQRGLAESYEVMLGLGLLCWVTPTGQRVRRHILAGQANIEFEANTGTLSVRPAADGVKLSFEMEMLDPDERPNVESQLQLEKALEATTEAPWDRAIIEPILRGWVHALDSEGTYEPAEEKLDSFDRKPLLVLAPAVFLRRRTGRSLVQVYKAIIEQIKRGEEVPFGVARLLEIETEPREWAESHDDGGDDTKSLEDTMIHFPLPANEEQREIVKRMKRDQGVLVQGPPGTGKSHTIANLICHLLAVGKRILVTSQTPRALKVLRGKIPMELVPLCVSVLGNDRESLRGLEDSVHGITNHYHHWNETQNEKAIQRCEKEIFELQKRRAVIDSRLREQREKDTYKVSVADGVYQGTAQNVAQRVFEEASLYDWFPDHLTPDAGCPLTKSEIKRLLEAFRSLSPARISELKKRAPSLDSVPSIEAFVRLIEKEGQAQTKSLRYGDARASTWYQILASGNKECRERASRALRELMAAVGTVLRRPTNWIPNAVHSFMSDQDKPLRELRESTGKHLSGLTERARIVHATSIELPATVDRRKLRADATDLHEHLKSGGSLGWGPFRKDIVKRALYLTIEVRVNGRACKTVEVLHQLLQRLEVEYTLNLAWDAWGGLAERVTGPLPRQVSELEEHLEALDSVLALEEKLEAAKRTVADLPGLPEPKWQEFPSISELMAALEATIAEDELGDSRREIEEHRRILASIAAHPEAHPVAHAAHEAIKRRDPIGWGSVCHEIEQLERDKNLLEWQLSNLARLSEAAPKFAQHLSITASDTIWDDRVTQIDATWHWAMAESWLREYQSQQSVQEMEKERQKIENQIGDEVASLAAARAWRHCFSRMTPEHRSYLEAWRKEIQSIGKGTGKYAERHRRTAQKYMNNCRDAIPAWIMPFYRVAETVYPKKHCFDIAIVDEASQSGSDALLLLYLAKQIIIVGDNQQISPDDVGLDQTQVHSLQQRYLYDFGLKETFGTGYSLFDQAEIRYGNRIPLREHFRCMPEIIRFSNDMCYAANPLVPLRQYPPKRLEPIKVRHVPTGFREGGSQSARNRPEAEALVEAICQCCNDPAYEKKSMGVISLQGDYQAGLILQLLKDRLGEQEMMRREIICGDAYAFQGDERDIIFMSMVAAPNEAIGALVKQSDKRRFNVAASRPRDQVWLFHTATVNDLNPEDMRSKLLAFYQNPATSQFGVPDWGRCESRFEREVGERIHARGYRIVVQYEPLGHGGKRIDFVVEGESTRLAIECDGDRWHGPEEFDKDMFRQRQLERAGLEFWRIRGSEFCRNRETSMEPLWKKLSEMGVEPWDSSVKSARQEPSQETTSASPQFPTQQTLIERPARETLFTRNAEVATNIRDLPKDDVREALHSCIPPHGPVPREDLLHEVAKKLGYAKVGRNIRSTINRMIGVEVRAGRLKTDWEKVWKAENAS